MFNPLFSRLLKLFVSVSVLSVTIWIFFFTTIYPPRTGSLLIAAKRHKEQNGRDITKTSISSGTVDNTIAQIHAAHNTHARNVGVNQMHGKHPEEKKRVIRILTWTRTSRQYWFGRKHEGMADCNTPIPCEYSNNRSLYNASDVILFHRNFPRVNGTFPSFRLSHQHWMKFYDESPVTARTFITPPITWFNWTIAYTVNADIVLPYGICLPNREKIEKDPSSVTENMRLVYGKRTDLFPWISGKETYQRSSINHAKGKSRLVLWAVGHCNTSSKREKYVEELKRHIDVYVIGRCGGHACGKGHSCEIDLLRAHKFYLSFENSLCAEYITEKLWRRIQEPIVPIVLGGADYKKYLPKHSYIDIKDFASPKELAAYLHKLDKHDDLYNEYFAWKQNYTCYNGIPGNSLLCSVCRFMNENLNNFNTIPNIRMFWNEGVCKTAKEYYGNMLDGN